MKFVTPEVYLFASTRIEPDEMRAWLDSIGAVDFPDPYLTSPGDNQESLPPHLSTFISDPEYLAGVAGKRCYKSFAPGLNPNVTKVRSDWGEYFANILAKRDGSILEHANFTFAIENVSRIFETELVRHRAGTAFSIQSGRYVRLSSESPDVPFVLPPSLAMDDSGSTSQANWGENTRRAKTQLAIRSLMFHTERVYQEICELWGIGTAPTFNERKAITSMIRRILPQGMATGMVVTMNVRALRHIITMRAAPEAEEEIAMVFSKIGKMMMSVAPYFFSDFEEIEGGFLVPKNVKV